MNEIRMKICRKIMNILRTNRNDIHMFNYGILFYKLNEKK